MDPVTYGVISGGLLGVAAEMKTAVIRNSYTPIVAAGGDLSVGIANPSGQHVAQGRDIPAQLGTLPNALRLMLPHISEDLGSGDVFIANDPHLAGALHLNDVIMLMPAFAPDDTLLGFLLTSAHWMDIGSATPGSYDYSLRDMYAEGLHIPPVQIMRRGKIQTALWELIFNNLRDRSDREWDFRAQLAGCTAGERGLIRMATRYGVPAVHAAMDEALLRGERRIRRRIAELKDGDYHAVDWLEFAGQAVRLELTIRIRGEDLTFDWTGTDPAVDGAINNPLGATAGMSIFALTAALDPGAPSNAGLWKPITTVAPPGCLVNPVPPSASAATCVMKIPDMVLMALASAAPDKVMAGNPDTGLVSIINSYDPLEWRRTALGRGRSLFLDQGLGGMGARAHLDGYSVSSNGGNVKRASMELLEFSASVRGTQYRRIPDTGGPGEQRGGCGVVREWEALADADLTLSADRAMIGAVGLFGGGPGAPGRYLIKSGEQTLELPAKARTTIPRGQRFWFQGPGGGGYGKPWDRAVEAVVDDYLDGAVSRQGAARDYGVILSEEGFVDAASTDALRTTMAEAFLAGVLPVRRGSWALGSVSLQEADENVD